MVGSKTSLNSVITILDYRDPDKDDVVTFHKQGLVGWEKSGVSQYTLDETTGEILLAYDATSRYFTYRTSCYHY